MSHSKKVVGATGSASPITPAGATASANPATPASLTPAQAQEWQSVLKQLDDNKWWVLPVILTAAGLEIAHILWLAGRFVYFFATRR